MAADRGERPQRRTPFGDLAALLRRADAARPSARGTTVGAPHVRDAMSVRAFWVVWIVAVLPCALFGLWNLGHLANVELAALGSGRPPGWRVALLASLGIGTDPASVLACAAHGALYFVPVFAASFAAARVWELGFALVRRRPFHDDFGLTPLLFALTLPPTIPLWQAALGMSFGIVLGREVFGGIGKNFVNPALAGRAFLYFAYPAAIHGDAVWLPIDGFTGATPLALGQTGGLDAILKAGFTWTGAGLGVLPGGMGSTSALLCAVGALVLIATRTASWRVMAGGVLGLVGSVLLLGQAVGGTNPMAAVPWTWQLVLGGFAFGIVFLATDPASAAHTDPGRWLYGVLVGAMTALIRVVNTAYPEGVMLAILFANVFAPLIDHVVIQVHLRQRAARGRRRAARRPATHPDRAGDGGVAPEVAGVG
jgi:Na+-transporting NADH:ubiquinone oxidoreductase subunit B